jgi:hypothetical protein
MLSGPQQPVSSKWGLNYPIEVVHFWLAVVAQIVSDIPGNSPT